MLYCNFINMKVTLHDFIIDKTLKINIIYFLNYIKTKIYIYQL